MANDYFTFDVCATCGRPAIWPFCEHRSSTATWTRPLVVRPVYRADREWVLETRGKKS